MPFQNLDRIPLMKLVLFDAQKLLKSSDCWMGSSCLQVFYKITIKVQMQSKSLQIYLKKTLARGLLMNFPSVF